ncbi:MAG: lipid A biosynthesis acyltransferase [Ferruginibacter sp.]
MYYIIYGLFYLISLLPFFILYHISDFAFFLIYYVIGYRRKIVMDNLTIAFPEKSNEEKIQIAKNFYKNLTDTFIETIKLFSISKKEFNKRAIMNLDECNALAAKGKSLQFSCGHQMNWEYGNWVMSQNMNIPWVGVYMKINNKALDRLFFNLRSKKGTVLVAAQEFKSRIHQVFNQSYSLGLAADQNPGAPGSAYWLNFFTKAVPFVPGPDKGAIKTNAAVVFVKFVKTKRGFYEFIPTIITENGSSLKEGELTLLYRDYLEATIREHPDNYLWSHNRWKWNYKEEYKSKWIDRIPAPVE